MRERRHHRLVLWCVSRIVPRAARDSWIEEWRAELQHARGRMLRGAVADALAVRAHSAPAQRLRPLHGLGHDLRYAVRGLFAAPGFAGGVILSLATGLAATTAAFSFANGLALEPPAGVQRPDGLRRIWVEEVNRYLVQRSTYGMYHALQSTRSFAGVAATAKTEVVVDFPGEPLRVPGAFVSGNYFELLGVAPHGGALISAGMMDAVVLSTAPGRCTSEPIPASSDARCA